MSNLALATLTGSNVVLGKPCILLTGDTGTGKTHTFGSMARAGYRGLLGDVERRTKHVQRYGLLVKDLPTRADISNFVEIIGDPEKRMEYVSASTKDLWDDVDFIGFDSLLEYEWRLFTELGAEFDSHPNKFKKWDEYSQRYVNLMRRLRDAAASSKPVGVIMIMGERADRDQYGNVYFKSLIKGNVAPDRAPFIPDFHFHMEATIEAGRPKWYCYTVGGPGFTAKGPGLNVLPAKIDITDGDTEGFAIEVWKKLENYLKGE